MASHSSAAPAAGLSRLAAERPEAWVYAASAACWAALLLLPGHSEASAFCVGGGRLDALRFAAGAAWAAIDWPLALAHWLLMIGAMMLPMTAMALRHIAMRSFRARRARGQGLFLIGYLAVWTAAAPFYLGARLALDSVAAGGLLLPLAGALALAASWQATPAKARALRGCHRIVPLPQRGWPGDRACLGYGLEHGRHCLVSCWALMLVPVAAGHHLLPMLAVAAAAFVERRLPRFRPRRGALPLAAAACLCLAPAAAAALVP